MTREGSAVRVLYIGPDTRFGDRLTEKTDADLDVVSEPGIDTALPRLMSGSAVDCAVVEHAPPATEGIPVLKRVHDVATDVPVVFFARNGSEHLASRAVAEGAAEYVPRYGDSEGFGTLANRIERCVRERSASPGDRVRRRFEAMFNDSNILVGLLDPDGTVIDINDRALEYIDDDIEEVVGKPLWKTPWFVGEEPKARIEELIRRAAEGEYVEFEIDLSEAVPDGLVVHGTVRPVTDANGDIVSLIISDRDITKRKRREQELELRTRAMDAAPVGIVITDPDQADNPIVYANDGFEQLTGYGPEEALGRNCRFLQGPLTDSSPVARMRDAVDAEETVAVDVLNYRTDGKPFWNRVRITPVDTGADGQTRFIGFQDDITERVEQERRTALLNRVLRHNIRNDLAVVLGNLEVLAAGDAADEPLAAARRAAERLLDLSERAREVQSLLEDVSFQPEPQSVDALLSEAVDAAKRGAYAPGVDLAVEADPDLTVAASDAVVVALGELVGNAIEHAEGPPEVSISASAERQKFPPEGTERDVVVIKIEDRNPPITNLDLTVLLGGEERPTQHGTGIGLWLVRWLTTMSGGTIAYEERSPRGNVISVTLPRPTDEGR